MSQPTPNPAPPIIATLCFDDNRATFNIRQNGDITGYTRIGMKTYDLSQTTLFKALNLKNNKQDIHINKCSTLPINALDTLPPLCYTNQMNEISIITCPTCGHAESETMPTDACQWFYDCKGCGTVLKPLEGDCCVYCSYGSVPCPSIQESQ